MLLIFVEWNERRVNNIKKTSENFSCSNQLSTGRKNSFQRSRLNAVIKRIQIHVPTVDASKILEKITKNDVLYLSYSCLLKTFGISFNISQFVEIWCEYSLNYKGGVYVVFMEFFSVKGDDQTCSESQGLKTSTNLIFQKFRFHIEKCEKIILLFLKMSVFNRQRRWFTFISDAKLTFQNFNKKAKYQIRIFAYTISLKSLKILKKSFTKHYD